MASVDNSKEISHAVVFRRIAVIYQGLHLIGMIAGSNKISTNLSNQPYKAIRGQGLLESDFAFRETHQARTFPFGP